MNTAALITRLDELLAQGAAVLQTRRFTGPDAYKSEHVQQAELAAFRSTGLSFLQRVYDTKHPHFLEFQQQVRVTKPSDTECGIAILKAVRSEIAGGWLFTVKGLVAAEVFADFLEMAEHLLDQSYKDPAAVMAGSVLEEHLRQLCAKHAIPLTERRGDDDVAKKAERLNADLAGADVYNKLEQKQITAWLDLRNKAAHGDYDSYTDDQVREFLAGLISFTNRVPL